MDETAFPAEEWAGLMHSLKGKIDPLDVYWTVFDSKAREDPVQGSSAGDISENYTGP